MRVKDISQVVSECTDFDNAITLTGYGKFHYETILVCSLSVLTVGFQNGISSYIFPAAQAELNLTSFELGLLNVAFLAGGILSCFLWGSLADNHGRRKILIITHLFDASISIIFSVIPNTTSLVICRLFNGFFIGAPASIIFSYFAEFQPPKYRSRIVCYCGLFFTVAWLLMPTIAYFILPVHIKFKFGQVILITPWRLLVIITALPEIAVGFWFMRLPESPKFFAAKGNTRKALMILSGMYATNTGKERELYPVKKLISDINHNDRIMIKSSKVCNNTIGQMRSLFKPPLLAVTALNCSIMFANMFGMFGLGLWLPELFKRFKQYQMLNPNGTISIKELESLKIMNSNMTNDSFDPSVIQSTIAMAIASLVYNSISCWISAKIQTRIISMISMLLGGAAALSIYWMRSAIQNLMVSCIFQATMITANMTISGIGVELFPTNVNGIALCFIMFSGRIGAVLSNIVFGYFIDTHCEIPIFVVAFIVLAGGLLCMVVPSKPSKSPTTINKGLEISVIKT